MFQEDSIRWPDRCALNIPVLFIMSSTVVILEKTYLKAVGTGKNFSDTMRHKAASEKNKKEQKAESSD